MKEMMGEMMGEMMDDDDDDDDDDSMRDDVMNAAEKHSPMAKVKCEYCGKMTSARNEAGEMMGDGEMMEEYG